jgi:cytochrome c peroxidase
VGGKLSEAARRGEEVFSRAGCAECHPPPLFTDLHQYDVGTRRGFDRPADKFDTPALVELWRTAPFLHDGSAATVRDVLTTRNPRDRHGKTSDLTKQEVEDLCAYLLSL